MQIQRPRIALVLVALLLATGCSPVERLDGGAEDAGEDIDAQPRDSGPPDAGPNPADSGPDAGPVDAGITDGGTTDAGAFDGGPDAGPAPDAPVLEGEASAGHDSPTWLWNTPAGATEFRYRIDGGAYTTTSDASHRATGLAAGSYTIEVLACTASGVCSSPGSFTTVIESLGPGHPDTVWDGVERPNLPTSPLGNVAPVACHNCYNGPNDEVLGASAGLAKIRLALSNDADLIELDVGDAGGTLCVHHADPDSCAGAPTLPEILADATFASSDAMLFVELFDPSTSADPATFATQLLDVLDANRDYVRNGRPLFVRASIAHIAYLDAIRAASADYPLIANYLRYSVRYPEDAFTVTNFRAHIQTNVADAGFDMIELSLEQGDFSGVVDFARSLGLGVAVYTVPSAYGHALIAAVREMVDMFNSEFIVSQARFAVEEENVFAYANGRDCISQADTHMSILRNHSGTFEADSVLLDQAPAGDMPGTPPLFLDAGQDWFGCTLDYRAQDGRAVSLGAHANDADGGLLVAAYVNFDSLSALPAQQSIVANTEGGGFGLEMQTLGTGETLLQFVVHVGGSYRNKSYDVAATGLDSSPSLNNGDGYFLLGVYDGDGEIRLWINGESSESNPTVSGGVTPSTAPVLIGAEPGSTPPLARAPFHGLVQSVSVLRWGNHDFAGPQVN